jgi:hypothetical protein
MKPIGWTREWVGLRCSDCEAAVRLSWSGYLTALEHDQLQICTHCGHQQPLEDRRQMHLPVERERRLG